MTKQEAILEMRKGVKITHVNFSPNEWMTMQGLHIILEDGVKCNAELEFWPYRTGSGWEDGYSVFKEVTETMPDKKLTPMMELIEWAKENVCNGTIQEGSEIHYIEYNELIRKIKKLQEKERQMVIDAAVFAYKDMYCLVDEISDTDFMNMKKDAEQYYKQTYKS